MRPSDPPTAVRLRRPPPLKYPRHPYPVLGHYTHPDLLAGRERDLADLRRQLTLRVPILGLFAPSGSGKSSLLAGGLVPALRQNDVPVAFERRPSEPRLVRRLLHDLMDDPPEIADDDPAAFADALAAVHRAAGRPPVLVLDQFEDVLVRGHKPRLGRLLAATVFSPLESPRGDTAFPPLESPRGDTALPHPELDGPPCRWILAYRHEYHGEIVRWLSDVSFPPSGSDPWKDLPRDLSGPDRFEPWPVPVLAPSEDDAGRVFLEAITRPLTIERDGERLYSYAFADGDAERLAEAFAKARAKRPTAPLVPELQVVLERLLAQARGRGGVAIVQIQDDPESLIDEALEVHLKGALERAFPGSRRETRIPKTRAVLALRELADVHGRRERGTTGEALARAIGDGGRLVLDELATERTRLVVREEHDEGWFYVLSHDRMAEVLVKVVDEGDFIGLGVDEGLLRLRRLVTLQSQLFAVPLGGSRGGDTAGDREEATKVASGDFRGIEENAEALLWDEEQREWWEACGERRRRDRTRQQTRWMAAAVVVVVVGLVTWLVVQRISRHQALFEQVRLAPELAFAALAELSADGVANEKLLDQLRGRKKPFDVFERGFGDRDQEDQEGLGAAVLRVVKVAEPLLEEDSENPVRIALVVLALDFATAQDPALAEQAVLIRDRVLDPLRTKHPPPSEDPDWVLVPGGTFLMGSPEGQGHDDEHPQHTVTVSPFRMLRHEVTNAEYRQLFAEHAAGETDDHPAAGVSWYEAYTYAAWLGGRLPTEAEWEYAARADCEYSYCRQDGSETTVDEVAWTRENSGIKPHPVMQLEPNSWGLYDMLGNLWEWTADGYVDDPQAAEKDPWRANSDGWRVIRGGSFWDSPDWARPANRVGWTPDLEVENLGFRVAWPGGPEP